MPSRAANPGRKGTKMKNYLFVIDKVQGTDGEREVGSWKVNIELSIEAANINSAIKKFNVLYPAALEAEGWTATGITYSTYLVNPDYDTKEFLQTFSAETKTWGGAREGAGRPATGRKRQNFYITDVENQLLREYLERLREETQMGKTMKIHWKHEDQLYTGYAAWIEDNNDKYISFTADDSHKVFDRVDAEECASGITLADIWQDIVDRNGDVTNFELK